MELVKVGILAFRSPDGEFLPEKKFIYREIEESTNNCEYIPLGELSEIFADKFKAYKVANSKIHKEGKK